MSIMIEERRVTISGLESSPMIVDPLLRKIQTHVLYEGLAML